MVNFNFHFDSGTTLQQMVGFELAGEIWSSYLKDPITVNLQVGVSSSLGSNVIGGALPGMDAGVSYSTFTNALKADATSANDQLAVQTLYGSGSFYANYHGSLLTGGVTQWTGTGTSLNMTRADAKALGIINPNDSGLDGYILFGSLAGTPVQWSYDYTRSAPTPANSLDFLSTALHEIGHVLGFDSSLDSPGWLDTSFGTSTSALNAAIAQANSITSTATPLDLFRYDVNGSGLANARDLSQGGTAAFVIGWYGSKPIAYFSTGDDTTQGGNGFEASHWLPGTNAIMAPTLQTGTRSAIAAIDLTALDVIGYNLAPNGINTPINLAALQSQAQQVLASSLGQTVSWLNANSTTAAQLLATDGTQAINTMITNSKIYGLNRITPSGSAGTTSLIYTQLFQEQGLFDTIDDLEVLPAVTVQPSLEALAATTLPTDYVVPSGQSQPLATAGSDSLSKIALALSQTNSRLLFSPSFQEQAFQEQDGSQHRSVNAVINLSSQKVQPLPPSSSIAPSSDRVSTDKADYYLGSSKPADYEASDKSIQQQFDPLANLVAYSAAL